MASNGNSIVTEAEAAHMLRLSLRTLQRMRAGGVEGPPFVRLTERRIGYRVADLNAWAESRVSSGRALASGEA